MRLIYNDALNKRIAPYLERLTKKRTTWIPGMAHTAIN